jgi:general secretion pathway protein G
MNKKGFTLIELLVVIAIIGIVAAIATLNLLTALHKGKQKATMGEMRNVVNKMKDFENDIVYSNGNFTYSPKIN